MMIKMMMLLRAKQDGDESDDNVEGEAMCQAIIQPEPKSVI